MLSLFLSTNPPSKLLNLLTKLNYIWQKDGHLKDTVFLQLLESAGQGGGRPKLVLKEKEAVYV